MSLALVPDIVSVQDIPGRLRELADLVESGRYGDAHNLAWVIDGGSGVVHVGLLGAAAEHGVTAHFLFAIGQLKIMQGALG